MWFTNKVVIVQENIAIFTSFFIFILANMTIGHLNANDVTQKLCGRYHQLVDRNGICVSQMAIDLFSFIYCFLSSFTAKCLV